MNALFSASTEILVRAVQLSNALALKYFNEAGRLTATRAVQPANALLPIFSTFLPIYKSVRALLPAKASVAIVATPSPVFTLLRPAFLNAPVAISLTEAGTLISARAAQPEKLSAPIYVSVSGRETALRFSAFLNVLA